MIQILINIFRLVFIVCILNISVFCLTALVDFFLLVFNLFIPKISVKNASAVRQNTRIIKIRPNMLCSVVSRLNYFLF